MSNPNIPAFPVESGAYSYDTGLSKREYIAALAMQGLLSNLADIRKEGFKDHEIEEFAVMRADALLQRLEEVTRK